MSERRKPRNEMKGLFAKPSLPEEQPTIDTHGLKQGDWVTLDDSTALDGAQGQIEGFEANLAGTIAHVRFNFDTPAIPVLVTGLRRKETISETDKKLIAWIIDEFKDVNSQTTQNISQELTIIIARILNTIEVINSKGTDIPPEESLKTIKEFEVYPSPRVVCRMRASKGSPPYYDVRFSHQ